MTISQQSIQQSILPKSIVTGDVIIGKESSIWFHTVIRGDVSSTRIGERVNIQDQSMLHQSPNKPLVIEDDVTIGHQVLLHSAVIRKKCTYRHGEYYSRWC